MNRYVLYFASFIAYLFILVILAIFVKPFLGLLLWLLAGLVTYELANRYRNDFPWIEQVLNDIENFDIENLRTRSLNSTEDDDNEIKKSPTDTVVQKAKETVSTYSNKIEEEVIDYTERFDKWQSEKGNMGLPDFAIEEKVRNFSFNSKGLYKFRLWILIIVFPLVIWWFGILNVVWLPIYAWYNILGFTTFQAQNMASASTLGLSFFITARIYSHCTNHRTLPINSEIFSDYDNYAIRHLFKLPRKGSIAITGKAMFLNFIFGWLLLIPIIGIEIFEGITCSPAILNELDGANLNFLTIFTLMLYVSVLTPIVEELVFRGFVLDVATEAYGKWFSIFISAFLFAIVHIDAISVINAFIGGLIYGYVRIKTDSLWPSIFLHFAWNTHLYLIFLLCS